MKAWSFKNSRRIGLLVFIFFGLLWDVGQARAVQDTTVPTTKGRIAYIVPKNWTEGRADDRHVNFKTAQGIAVTIGFAALPNQTAREWASDELKEYEHSWREIGMLGDGIPIQDFSVVTRPTDVSIGGGSWVLIAWERAATFQGQAMRQKSEQYFRKYDDTLVQILVLGASVSETKTGPSDKIRPDLEQFLSSLRVKGAQATPQQAHGDGWIHHADNVGYANSTLGFMIVGPRGWAGLTQYEDANGKPAYPFLPPQTRSIFKKQYPDNKPPFPFNPIIEVDLYPNQSNNTALELLREYVKTDRPEAFLMQPREVAFGEKTWAVCELRTKSEFQGAAIPVIEKIYLLPYKQGIIVIKGASNPQEYEADRVLFDQTITKMKFTENVTKTLLTDIVSKAGTQQELRH